MSLFPNNDVAPVGGRTWLTLLPTRRIRPLRQRRKLSLRRAAEEIGVDPNVVLRAEKGLNVYHDHAELIANWLWRNGEYALEVQVAEESAGP